MDSAVVFSTFFVVVSMGTVVSEYETAGVVESSCFFLPQEQRHASISNIHNEILKCFITNPYKKSSGVTEITPLVDWLDYLPPMMPPMRPIIASMIGLRVGSTLASKKPLIVSKIELKSMDYLSFF